MKGPQLNNRGSHHIFLGIILIFLCAVGGWSMWNWYKQGMVKENLQLMLTDFSEAADSVVTDQGDKTAVNEKVEQIRQIINKYAEKQ